MRGDLTVRIAYGAAWTLTVVYRDTDGDPIDVTGYTAELRLSRYNGGGEPAGDLHGETVLALAATVGTTNGQISRSVSGAQTLALADTFGDPVPRERGRWSLWVTPPAQSAFPLVYGWVEWRPLGEAVSDTDQDVYSNTFSASVSAVGARGEAGPQGAQGPPGDGTQPTDGSVTTTSRDVTTVQTIDLSDYLNKNWRIVAETTATTASNKSTWTHEITGFTASDGTTTHADPIIQGGSNTGSLGTPLFENGSAALVHRVRASTTTSTKWARSARIVQTWDP